MQLGRATRSKRAYFLVMPCMTYYLSFHLHLFLATLALLHPCYTSARIKKFLLANAANIKDWINIEIKFVSTYYEMVCVCAAHRPKFKISSNSLRAASFKFALDKISFLLRNRLEYDVSFTQICYFCFRSVCNFVMTL